MAERHEAEAPPVRLVFDVWTDRHRHARSSLDVGGAWRPVGVGSDAEILVRGHGVLPVHAWIGVSAEHVWIMSADDKAPAYALGRTLPARWSKIAVPCLVRLGTALVKIGVAPSDYGDEDPTTKRTPVPPSERRPPAEEEAPTLSYGGRRAPRSGPR